MNEIVTSAASRGTVEPTTTQALRDALLASPESQTLRSHRTKAEIYAIRQALEQTGWIRKRAARTLAISYRSLLYKIQRYKITRNAAAKGEGQELMAQPSGAGQN